VLDFCEQADETPASPVTLAKVFIINCLPMHGFGLESALPITLGPVCILASARWHGPTAKCIQPCIGTRRFPYTPGWI